MFEPNRTIALLKGALFEREATWRAYLPEAGDWQRTALLLSVPLIVVSTLAGWLLGLVFGDASLLGQFRPGLLPTLLGMVLSCVGLGVMAYVFSAMAGVFGGKASFALGLAALTLAFVPGYVGQVMTWLPWIGTLLAIALGIFSLVQLWKIIPIYLHVPDSKRAPHYIVSLLIGIVFMAVVSRFVAPMIYGDVTGPAFSSRSDGGRSGGFMDDINRQAEIIAAANKASYAPPDDGMLTENQVRNYVTVMTDVRQHQAETLGRIGKLAEDADRDKQITSKDMGSFMSGMKEVRSMGTAEMEGVMQAGGNWAEHLWVRETFEAAPRNKDSGAAGAHNYDLYQQYANQIPSPAVK